jgi:RNA 2',3'-cyclic 3'-phosphodiesterase
MRVPHFHRLFLALRPPRHVAAEIRFWRDSLMVGGKLVCDDRLHMTLLMLGDFADAPCDLIAGTRKALSGFPLPACRIVLDSLTGGVHSAFLAPSETLHGVKNFRAKVVRRLSLKGIVPAPRWRFSPHVTLLHEPGDSGTWPIDAISWTADALVLIESLVGQTRHVTRASWPLGPDD